MAAGYARRLPDLGADGVSIILSNTSPGQMALFVALVATGRLAALFPPNAPLQDERAFFEQQRHALSRIDPAHIYLFSPALSETVRLIDPMLGERVVVVEDESGDDATDAEIAALHAAFQRRLDWPGPIFVQHSSGTTGIKKAVAITGVALHAQFHAYWPMLRTACGAERLHIASWLPLYHDMGLLTSLLLPLLGEDSVSIVDPFEWIAEPDRFLRMIEQDRCNIAWMPNFAFRHFVRLARALPPRDLSSMKLWVDCSEPCRFADAAAFEAGFGRWGVRSGSVLGCYAMAETVFAATMCPLGEQRALSVPYAAVPGADLAAAGAAVFVAEDAAVQESEKLVLSSGRALPGLDVAVLVDGQAAAPGIYGEIALRGGYLFSGYRNMNQEESNIGADGYFRTGDLGAIIDGHVFVFGRLKEIIIVNGKNLFAGDIETAVGAIPGVKKGRAVAFGLESAQTGSEELIVIAEHSGDADAPAAVVRQEINRIVAEQFMVKPRDVRVVADRWLVKSTSGKISRSENLTKYLGEFRRK
jgi:acyl-CoA synthetase (AMP-forming)/AMP-acid ligase II